MVFATVYKEMPVFPLGQTDWFNMCNLELMGMTLSLLMNGVYSEMEGGFIGREEIMEKGGVYQEIGRILLEFGMDLSRDNVERN